MKKALPFVILIFLVLIGIAIFYGLDDSKKDEIEYTSTEELINIDNSYDKFEVYRNHEMIYTSSGTYLYFGMYPKSVVLDNSLIQSLDRLNTVNSRGNFEYNGYEYRKISASAFEHDFDTIPLTDEEYHSKVLDSLEEYTYNYIEDYIKLRPNDEKSKVLKTFDLHLDNISKEELEIIKSNNLLTIKVSSSNEEEAFSFDFDIDLSSFDFDSIKKSKEVRKHEHFISNSSVEIENGKSYYFLMEPILWKVLQDNGSNNYILISNDVIDAYYFDLDTNEYEESDLREYLNNNFYNYAFDTNEKNSISKSKVDSLEDKIYCLSTNEYNTFKPITSKSNPTDYSIANGVYVNRGYSTYLLRTKVEGTEKNIYKVDDTGLININGTNSTYYGISAYSGIRPVMKINFIN